MTVTRRTFTREELEALDVPHNCVHTETVGQWRHGTRETGVFELDGHHWSVNYYDSPGADEPCDPWNYADKVTATEVRLATVTVERWVPVETEGATDAR